MPTYTEYIEKVQEDVLNQIKEAQDASLKSFAAMPKFEGFPTPSEVIEQTFDFAEKFLELRKAYTLKVADLIETAQKQFVEAARPSKSAKHN